MERKKEKLILKSVVGIVLSFFMVGGMLFSSTKVNAQKMDPIKIGCPADLSGNYTGFGVPVKKICEEFVKPEINDKGGILGRKIEFIYYDSASDPATAVRNCNKLVQSDKVRFIVGLTGSDQVAAIIGKLPEWDAIYVSSINGAGPLTAKMFNPHFFRVNNSGPISARILKLFLRDSAYKNFMILGNDYIYGHSACEAFEREIKSLGRVLVAPAEYAPQGTKDYSSWIARIQQRKPDALFAQLVGEDSIAFFKQAKVYGLLQKVQVIMEQLYLKDIIPTGDIQVGVIGSTRYTFTNDFPENKKFVEKHRLLFKDSDPIFKGYPDVTEGETYQAVHMLLKAIEKAGTADDTKAVIKAFEGLEYDGPGGKVYMRPCDHQSIKPGIMAKIVKDDRYPYAIQQVIKVYPGEEVTPPCRMDKFPD